MGSDQCGSAVGQFLCRRSLALVPGRPSAPKHANRQAPGPRRRDHRRTRCDQAIQRRCRSESNLANLFGEPAGVITRGTSPVLSFSLSIPQGYGNDPFSFHLRDDGRTDLAWLVESLSALSRLARSGKLLASPKRSFFRAISEVCSEARAAERADDGWQSARTREG